MIVRRDNDTLHLSGTFRGNCVSDTMAASTAGSTGFRMQANENALIALMEPDPPSIYEL